MARQTRKSKRPTRSSGSSKSCNAAAGKTKKQLCIALLERAEGTTVADLSKATGWQAHSVRGFLAGTAAKLPGKKLVSRAVDGKPRTYQLNKAAGAVGGRP